VRTFSSAVAVFGLSLSLALAGDGELSLESASADEGSALIEKYVTATKANDLSGLKMDAEVEASLPKLKKFGTLSALRTITKVGKITWDKLRFSGDNTIKKEVIARYIQTEQESREDTTKFAINNENYKFKYKGLESKNAARVHVFQLTPRKKAVGLFKGELWIDPETNLPVREAGEMVKSPSIFLKKVQFVREYEIVEGRSIPKHVESKINTRVWGAAEVSINYRNFSKADDVSFANTTN
jgi:hypothetical protein